MFSDAAELDRNAEYLLKECAAYARSKKQDTVAGEFDQIIAKSEESLYQIAVIGFLKRGKSTLLNVLLGKQESELAPVAATICTAAIVKYVDASLHPEKKKTAVIYFENGESKEVAYEQLKDYINNERNRDNAKAVKYIKVYGDFPLIKNVALVDTPGRGSVYTEHDTLSDEFLPSADAIILVQSANLPMEAEERKFLSSLDNKEKRRIFVVLTKKDKLKTDKDLTDSKNFVQEQLKETGIPCDKIYYTAAKKVIEAMKTGDMDAVERESQEWGITELKKDLVNVIEKNSDRTKIRHGILNAIDTRLSSFLSSQIERLEDGLRSVNGNIEDFERKKRDLTEAKLKLETDCKTQEGELRKNWDMELRGFKKNTDLLKEQIVDRLRLEIESKGLFQLWNHGKRLKRRVVELVQSEMAKPVTELQERLESSLQKFAAGLDESIYLAHRKGIASETEGISPIGGQIAAAAGLSLGGAAVAGVGYGAVTALVTAAEVGAVASWGPTILGPTVAATAAGTLTNAVIWGIGGVASLVVASFGYIVGEKMLASSHRESLNEAIPKYVEETMPAFVDNVQTQLGEYLKEKITLLRNMSTEKIDDIDAQNQEILASFQSNDPSVRERLDKDLAFVKALDNKRVELRNGINTKFILTGGN